jgi:hypothetical protein
LRRVLTALVLLVAIDPAPANAWGRDGHEIVATIAQSLLTPRARAQADALLATAGGESFVAVSDWADRIRRERPETAPWHFVDIEIGAGPYNEARDCPRRACVVAKIDDFRAELADTRLDPERRGEALKWLIHSVGDVHQPLHAADRHDHGGNGLHVAIDGRERNLHEVWDVELIKLAKGRESDSAYAEELTGAISAGDRSTWARGSAADWANEAHSIAERIAYGELSAGLRPTLTFAYQGDAIRAVNLQLERASVRLATVLNAALDPASGHP